MGTGQDQPSEGARRQGRPEEVPGQEPPNSLKNGPCADCGNGNLRPCQMDLWKDEGAESPSRMLLLSLTRIEARAAECTLLCANCSRLRTWDLERFRRSRPA